jgi:hypothetical protein
MTRKSNSAREGDGQPLADAVQDLAAIIERLRDEVEVLRQAVDDLRGEWTHELRNLRDALPIPGPDPPYRLTSMPQDSCADDFHERVNAFDGRVFELPPASGSDELPPPLTAGAFVERLMRQPATAQLAAEDWIEDQEFTPGEVVAIDPPIYDWFAEYPVTALQDADWFVVDDGLGSLSLLWTCDENCFVRRLTDEEQRQFGALTGFVLDSELDEDEVPPAANPTSNVPAASTSQQTLW